MTEIYVTLPKKEYIEFYLQHPIHGFFLGVENFSINFNHYIKPKELRKIIDMIKKQNKKIFVSLNKLFYDSQMEVLKKLLIELSKYNIDGLSFCDVAVYNIVKENNLNIPLIWNSYHLGTNYETINFWKKRGVEIALLSTEITAKEAIEIKKKSDIKICMTLYGYLNMATSSRSLLTNYFKFIKQEKKYTKYLMHEKITGEKYPIIEENGETNFFTSKILNGIEYVPELIKNKIDCIKLDDYMLDPNKFYNVIETYCALLQAPNDKKFVKKLRKVSDLNTYEETYDGFLDKKTVFKVKDYE